MPTDSHVFREVTQPPIRSSAWNFHRHVWLHSWVYLINGSKVNESNQLESHSKTLMTPLLFPSQKIDAMWETQKYRCHFRAVLMYPFTVILGFVIDYWVCCSIGKLWKLYFASDILAIANKHVELNDWQGVLAAAGWLYTICDTTYSNTDGSIFMIHQPFLSVA